MRCGHHDSATAFEVPHCVGELRRRPVSIEEHDLKSVGYHDRGAQLGEMPGTVPCIVSDRAGESARIRLAQDVVGKPLGALTDGSIVDRIRSDGVHPASSPPGSKGDDCPENIVEFFPILTLDVSDQLTSVLEVSGLR